MDLVQLAQVSAMWIMASLRTRINFKSERGATAVEYGLMVGLIAAVIMLAVTALGTQVRGVFCSVIDAINGAGGPPAACV